MVQLGLRFDEKNYYLNYSCLVRRKFSDFVEIIFCKYLNFSRLSQPKQW